ncbi:hypothetical protein F8388_010769 [Cannabis sativa]|uniref:RNase H type-1 domain-containing protein n=1 Tax=Cannabis sativa TaxID=3483 RepID=A0A7J6HBP8_CANSA|nr:hypothetical protein F8388_010769 [Cannabis sativa]
MFATQVSSSSSSNFQSSDESLNFFSHPSPCRGGSALKAIDSHPSSHYQLRSESSTLLTIWGQACQSINASLADLSRSFSGALHLTDTENTIHSLAEHVDPNEGLPPAPPHFPQQPSTPGSRSSSSPSSSQLQAPLMISTSQTQLESLPVANIADIPTPWLLLWAIMMLHLAALPRKRTNQQVRVVSRDNWLRLALQPNGPRLTWTNNGQGNRNTLERLDWAVENSIWHFHHPNSGLNHLDFNSGLNHLDFFGSGHRSIQILFDQIQHSHIHKKKYKKFLFENVWLSEPRWNNVLLEAWSSNVLSDDPSSSLLSKQSTCAKFLSNWKNKAFFASQKQHKTPSQHTTDCDVMTWEPPPISSLKLNVDGAISSRWSKTGGGALVRDSMGKVIAARASSRAGQMQPKAAEGWALLEGLRWCSDNGINIHHVEVDCKNLVTDLKSNEDILSSYGAIIHAIR